MCYPPLLPLDSADDKASKSSSVHCIFSSSSQFFSYVCLLFFFCLTFISEVFLKCLVK